MLFIYSGATKRFSRCRPLPSRIAAKIMIPALLAPYTSQLETHDGNDDATTLAVMVVGVFEVISGLMIALSISARGFLQSFLIFFVAATIFYFNDFWNQSPPENAKTLVDALKSLSIIGALFMIAGYGRGPRTVEPAYGDV